MSIEMRKLQNPPLVEVAMCIDMAGVPPVTKERVEQIAKSVAPAYEYDSDIREGTAAFNPENPNGDIRSMWMWKGVRFKAKKNIFIISSLDQQVVRFGYSKLAPYVSWEDFMKEGFELMRRVRDYYKTDIVVKRVGIRSVNRITLSGRSYSLKDIFRNSPASPLERKSVSIDEIFVRDSARYPEYDLYATTVKLGRKSAPGIVECFFDTDVFARPNSEWSQVKFEDLLARMRALKNDLFFGSVTGLWDKECL